MLRRKITQSGHKSDRHLVSVFPFSLDRQRPHEDLRTRSPKVYAARTCCLAQRRCLRRHFEEQNHTLEMTTFRFNLHHPNFVNVPKQRYFTRYWTFTQPIDVFSYKLVNGVMVIAMCGGTIFFASHPYSRNYDMLTNHKIIIQDNITVSCLTTWKKTGVEMWTTRVQVHPLNPLRLMLVPLSEMTVPSLIAYVVGSMHPLRYWNMVCAIPQGWNFSTPLASVPPFVGGQIVDQPDVEAMLLNLVYPQWFRNRMSMESTEMTTPPIHPLPCHLSTCFPCNNNWKTYSTAPGVLVPERK